MDIQPIDYDKRSHANIIRTLREFVYLLNSDDKKK